MERDQGVSRDARGSAPRVSTEHMEKAAVETGPVFGNAAAQSIIAKSREFLMQHKDEGKKPQLC